MESVMKVSKYLTEKNGLLYFRKRKPAPSKDEWHISLGLNKYQVIEAIQKIGTILADIAKGLEPSSPLTRIKTLTLTGKVSPRRAEILTNHIYPYFGEMKPREVSVEVLSDYLEYRSVALYGFGRDEDGELVAKKDTINKEFQALQALLRLIFGKSFVMERPVFNHIEFEPAPPLTFEQIELVADHGVIEKKYLPLFWFLVYTGVDIMDAITLKACEIKKIKDPQTGLTMNWIDRKRSKTQRSIFLPVCEALQHELNVLPIRLNPQEKVFAELQSAKNPAKATATYFTHAFNRVNLNNYSAKYLRRFIGSFLTNEGMSETWTAQALSHAPGSSQTKKYCQIYNSTMVKYFSRVPMRTGVKIGTIQNHS